jgi:hypothetical protein
MSTSPTSPWIDTRHSARSVAPSCALKAAPPVDGSFLASPYEGNSNPDWCVVSEAAGY